MGRKDGSVAWAERWEGRPGRVDCPCEWGFINKS